MNEYNINIFRVVDKKRRNYLSRNKEMATLKNSIIMEINQENIRHS